MSHRLPKEHPMIGWIERQELTQGAVAEKLDVSEPYLSLVLSGARATTFELAIKMRDLSGIPLEEFEPFAEATCRA